MKKYITLFIIVLPWVLHAAKPTTIRVSVSDNVDSEGVVVFQVHENFLRPLHHFFADVYRLEVSQNGVFHFELEEPETYFYINISYEVQDGKRRQLFDGLHPLLIEKGKDYHFRVNDDGVDLLEENDPLVQYQKELAEKVPERKVFGKLDESAFKWMINSVLSCVSELMVVSEHHEMAVPKGIRESLVTNFIFFHYNALAKSIGRWAFNGENEIANIDAFNALVQLLDDTMIPAEQCNGIQYIHDYVAFLASYQRLILKMSNIGVANSTLDNLIRDRFLGLRKGQLRDRLLLTHFMDRIGTTGEVDLKIHAHMQDGIENTGLRGVFLSISEIYGVGNESYNFCLKDTSGIVVRLDELRGRIVILEFWFYGCNPCKLLSSGLKEVLYSHPRKDEMLLVTINVDKKRENWIKGIKSGEYTDKRSIDLGTGKEGFGHEILQYYKFNSFPQLVIIDKQGNLVTAQAPRPLGADGQRDFLDILEKSLE